MEISYQIEQPWEQCERAASSQSTVKGKNQSSHRKEESILIGKNKL